MDNSTRSALPRTVVLDLQHHDSGLGEPQRLLSRLTSQAKISELLESLGNADILEIRFTGLQDGE